MKDSYLALPAIITMLATLPISADAATPSVSATPFLLPVSCPAGYVPGTKQTGCVRDVDPAKLRAEGAKRSSTSQTLGSGIATAAQVSTEVGGEKGTGKR